MNFTTMSKQRKFVLIASAIGVISMFLPWISVSIFGYSQSQNGMHDVGVLVFICFLASGLIAYMGDQTKNLDKTMWGVVLITGIVALLSIIYFYSKATDSIMGSSLVGFGLYLAALASIGVLVSAYMFKSASDNLKDSFENIKKGFESKINQHNTTTKPTETFKDTNNPNPPVV